MEMDDTPPWCTSADSGGYSAYRDDPPTHQRHPPDQLTYPTAQIRHQGAQAVKRGRHAG